MNPLQWPVTSLARIEKKVGKSNHCWKLAILLLSSCWALPHSSVYASGTVIPPARCLQLDQLQSTGYDLIQVKDQAATTDLDENERRNFLHLKNALIKLEPMTDISVLHMLRMPNQYFAQATGLPASIFMKGLTLFFSEIRCASLCVGYAVLPRTGRIDIKKFSYAKTFLIIPEPIFDQDWTLPLRASSASFFRFVFFDLSDQLDELNKLIPAGIITFADIFEPEQIVGDVMRAPDTVARLDRIRFRFVHSEFQKYYISTIPLLRSSFLSDVPAVGCLSSEEESRLFWLNENARLP
jgi:hypothetical protein